MHSLVHTVLRRSIRLALASIAAVTAGLALPIGAEATVSCTFDTGTGALTVELTAANTDGVMSLQRNGSDIEVFDGFADTPGILPTPCTNGPPTVTTTSSIQMTDTTSGQDTDFNLELGAGYFEPGTGGPAEGGGTAEIEIAIDGNDDGAFGDGLTLLGGTGIDDWHLGTLSGGANGVNLNAPEASGPDGDDISISDIENLQTFTDPVLGSMGAADEQLANGGIEFTGPFPLPSVVTGGPGDDILSAGTGNTYLGGDGGNDTMTGGPGDDLLRLSLGPANDDIADGGGGTDTCTYFNQGGDVTADLRITTQQNTGAGGLDTLTGCENLSGGDGNDTLIGTDGANVIDGGTLGSDAGADTLIGLGGNDHLIGAGGADSLDIRDGGPDTASCGAPTPGPPFDTVTADQQGVDTIDPDCEQVSFLTVVPPALDTLAPDTKIVSRPKGKTRKRKATIAFSSTEPGSRFECSLDRKAFATCASPFTKKVKARRHSFQVRAIDQAGNTDPTPALIRWRVMR